MLRFVQSASFELLKFKFVCEKLMFVMMKRRKKSYRERVVFYQVNIHLLNKHAICKHNLGDR